ncbi:MAG: hypothetical protein U9R04_03215 [Chloroflexota bacterium]|nr:hypothetical protein [Chloroflexota bacterium]
MKLSKATRWILAIGIFAILLITAGVILSQQKAEQRRLNSNIDEANQMVIMYRVQQKDLEAQKEDLEARLAQADSQIATAQKEFREYPESIEITDALFDIAHEANVTITGLSSSLPEEVEINGITCHVFSLSISAQDEVMPSVLLFTNKLSERFSTSTMESVSIVIIEAKEGTEESATIDLGLTIYFYEGK